MGRSRRSAIVYLLGSTVASAQFPDDQDPSSHRPPKTSDKDDPRLPDGKSQTIAIAKDEHSRALKDADSMVELAQQIRDEIKKAGDYVVPLATVKKTEEIEKLAKHIRGRLKS